MPQQVIGSCDPSRQAQVLNRWPLYYSAGADIELDRPAHVRAGSGLTNLGTRLALIQDDANFVAILDPLTKTVDSIALPALPCRQRQFDDLRGNRLAKLDLEPAQRFARMTINCSSPLDRDRRHRARQSLS